MEISGKIVPPAMRAVGMWTGSRVRWGRRAKGGVEVALELGGDSSDLELLLFELPLGGCGRDDPALPFIGVGTGLGAGGAGTEGEGDEEVVVAVLVRDIKGEPVWGR